MQLYIKPDRRSLHRIGDAFAFDDGIDAIEVANTAVELANQFGGVVIYFPYRLYDQQLKLCIWCGEAVDEVEKRINDAVDMVPGVYTSMPAFLSTNRL